MRRWCSNERFVIGSLDVDVYIWRLFEGEDMLAVEKVRRVVSRVVRLVRGRWSGMAEA